MEVGTGFLVVDDRVVEMIGEAVWAGAYRAEILQDPALAPGYGRLAAKHSAAATALADEIGRAATARAGGMVIAAPFTAGRRDGPQ